MAMISSASAGPMVQDISSRVWPRICAGSAVSPGRARNRTTMIASTTKTSVPMMAVVQVMIA